MHYMLLRNTEEAGPNSCPGLLYCLPDQVVGDSPVHGPLRFPVNPVKLASPGPPHSQPPPPTPLSSGRDPPQRLDPQEPPASHAGQVEEEEASLFFTVASDEEDRAFHDVSTLTDVCNSENVPEVEIISLLEERLPSYTLRADCLFGYEHDDWLHTPLLPPETGLQLTAEQIEETLKYFIMCSERVGQVTKTYHDIDAVTQLLEEKERDLELAARIGQSLLKQNRSLSERNECLEEQLELTKEEIAQLRHEVQMRDDLLHLYTSSVEDSEACSTRTTPLRHNESTASLQSCFHFDFLQQKLKGLEEENVKLRTEAADLEAETTNFEEQEQQLVIDCVQELTSTSKQMAVLSEELSRKVEDTVRQQEEISQLLAQIVDLQHRAKVLSTENEELNQHLGSAKEAQEQLKSELSDLQEKYSECEDMLHEAREEIKNLRNKNLPNSTINRYSALNVFPMDSLAAEIEGTMRKGLDSPAPPEFKNHHKRVFETVKAVNQLARLRSRCQSPRIPGSGQSSAAPSTLSSRISTPLSSRISTPRTSYYSSDNASVVLEDKPPSSQPAPNATHSEGQDKRLGQPGTPGGHDLEAALRRLSARQENHASERPFFDVERERKLRALTADTDASSGFLTPNESVLSTGTNYSGSSGFSHCSRSYLPDRLQIVKPLEGSMTLHHWQQLAQPNLGGILDPRPGVLTKDFRQLDIDLQEVYSLNDLEEDEVDLGSFRVLASSSPLPSRHPSRVSQSSNNLPQTPPTNTITTCRIMHPSVKHASVTRSLLNGGLPSCGCFGKLSTSQAGPHRRLFRCESSTNLREHTKMLSTSLGLVRLLQERGISASVYTPDRAGEEPRAAHFRGTCPGESQSDETLTPATSPITLKCNSLLVKTFPGSRSVLSVHEGEDSGSACEENIFSFNLVEKLQGLGLDKVVARGVISSKPLDRGCQTQATE
ncbi:trafficking kinesin-binding protein 1-like isoform X1 [Acipenser oxyrinchus oxyrinchus]|uniref:Trafficking kinesin-binding protein 1-like isoform X1 n=1 Tax=Acipenser oxyrinchus oxyrinchus TaxID=40147 RepID=A0AAD8D0H1_ACIOX|nr:trafficking kinesin-binding protein 1-like isoform X1 [Acipenser oxyrinchus oxyrinchus]